MINVMADALQTLGKPEISTGASKKYKKLQMPYPRTETIQL
jgi:hypothetical protein